MRAVAREHDLEGVGRRGERPRLRHDLTDHEATVHMRAEDRRHVVQRAARQHRGGPFAGLLGGLQHHHYVTRRGAFGEQARRAYRPCRVDVMAAGVHHAIVHRRVGETGGFLDRQRIDVAAHGDDRRAGQTSAKACHHARSGHALHTHRRERRERRELAFEDGRGPCFAERQLRVLMQIATQRREPGPNAGRAQLVQPRRCRVDRHGRAPQGRVEYATDTTPPSAWPAMRVMASGSRGTETLFTYTDSA